MYNVLKVVLNIFLEVLIKEKHNVLGSQRRSRLRPAPGKKFLEPEPPQKEEGSKTLPEICSQLQLFLSFLFEMFVPEVSPAQLEPEPTKLIHGIHKTKI